MSMHPSPFSDGAGGNVPMCHVFCSFVCFAGEPRQHLPQGRVLHVDFPGVSATEPLVHGFDHHRLPAHHLLPDLASHPQGIYIYIYIYICEVYMHAVSKGSKCIYRYIGEFRSIDVWKRGRIEISAHRIITRPKC